MEPLIATVRRYPCLWNTAAIEYRDQELKEAAWAEVMKETGLSSVKEVKIKWKKLRDSYRDALKRQSEIQSKDVSAGGSGGGSGNGSSGGNGAAKRSYSWKYMALMQFLQPHMNNRKKESLPSPRTSDSDSDESVPKRARLAPSLLHRKLDYLCQALPPPAAAPDPLDAFFAGMCHSTKRLPFAAQLKVKKLVFAAVTRAEEDLLEDGGGGWATTSTSNTNTNSDDPTDDKDS